MLEDAFKEVLHAINGPIDAVLALVIALFWRLYVIERKDRLAAYRARDAIIEKFYQQNASLLTVLEAIKERLR